LEYSVGHINIIMQNYNNNTNENFNDLFGRDPFEDETNQSSNSVSNLSHDVMLSNRIAFCTLMGTICDSPTNFQESIEAIFALQEKGLMGQVQSARSDPSSYWDDCLSERKSTFQEAMMAVEGSARAKQSDVLSAFQNNLWSTGSSTFEVGCSLEIDSDGLTPMARTVFQNQLELIRSIRSHKEEDIKNARENLINCMPKLLLSKYKSESAKKDLLQELIDGVRTGYMPKGFNPSYASMPREPGCMLPHTMEPKDWLAHSVADWVDQEYGEDFVVGFRTKDTHNVRRYCPEDGFILYSDDPEDAYSFETNPSIFCTSIEDDGSWTWRREQDLINSKVNIAVKKNQDASHEFVQAQRKYYTLSSAETYVQERGSVEWAKDNLSFFGRFNEVLQQKMSKKFILRFYKRGISKLNSVIENPEYIHVVGFNTATSVGNSRFFHVLLPDFNTVILMPMSFWNRSRSMRSRKGDLKQRYRTPLALEKPTGDISPYRAYIMLASLSHTYYMLECFESGEPYDAHKHTQDLLNVVSNPNTFPVLLGSNRSRYNSLRAIMSVLPGTRQGFYACPKISKIGRGAERNLNRTAGFDSEISDQVFGMDVNSDLFDFGNDTSYFDEQFEDSIYDDDSSLDAGLNENLSRNGNGSPSVSIEQDQENFPQKEDSSVSDEDESFSFNPPPSETDFLGSDLDQGGGENFSNDCVGGSEVSLT